jgi:hypothetical protein
MTTCLLVLIGDKLSCTVFFPSGKQKHRVKLEDYDPGTQALLKTNGAVLLNNQTGLREPLNREQIKQLRFIHSGGGILRKIKEMSPEC